MNELQRLIDRCFSVSIEFNEHRMMHQSVAAYVEEMTRTEGTWAPLGAVVLFKMCRRDQTVGLQCYPRNAVGFFTVGHYDLEKAVAEAHAYLDKEAS
jgi:hypothetical protein